VVLSGGAAKGFAHIGVLRALEEAGVPVDQIGGTSMGSVIAAQYAAGATPGEMLELNRLWASHSPLRDLTLPVIALVSGTSGLALLERMFGDRRIEDLWLDYFCVSANLTHSHVVVHRDGLLRQWVRASVAIPGIVPPLRLENGDLLVDGAVLNNLPADIVRGLGAGCVVAVDVTPPEALPTDDYVDQPSTWQQLRLLRSALLPFGAPVRSPTIFSILYRSVLTASRSLSERLKGEVDLYIAPRVDGVGFFEWKALERIAELGFREARQRLEGWEHDASRPTAPAARRSAARASGRGRGVAARRRTAAGQPRSAG
jgi:predicted acylesterase/phospholipase RssA